MRWYDFAAGNSRRQARASDRFNPFSATNVDRLRKRLFGASKRPLSGCPIWGSRYPDLHLRRRSGWRYLPPDYRSLFRTRGERLAVQSLWVGSGRSGCSDGRINTMAAHGQHSEVQGGCMQSRRISILDQKGCGHSPYSKEDGAPSREVCEYSCRANGCVEVAS